MIEDSDLEPDFDDDGVPQERRRPPPSRTRPRGTGRDADDEFKPRLLSSSKARQALARTCAVLAATAGMVGLLSVFGFLILESARRMRDHWEVYQKGAERLTDDIKAIFKRIP